MVDEKEQLGPGLIALKVVREYIKFLKSNTDVEIESLTAYYVIRYAERPTDKIQKQVLEEVLKLLEKKSARHRRSK